MKVFKKRVDKMKKSRRSKKLKKLLALLLSVCLMVGTTPLMNNVAAAWSLNQKEGYSEDVTTLKANQTSIDKLLENGKGIIYGSVPYIYNYQDDKWNGCNSMTYATDGILNEFYPYTGLYSYVTFQLDDVYDLTEFGLVLKNSSYRNSYEVYVGTSYDTLYSGTPVYVFDGTAEGYTSSMGQYVQFTSDETYTQPRGSILGIKFTECMNSSGELATANRAVRVAEIFANGTPLGQDVAGMALDLSKYDQYYYNYASVTDDNLLKYGSIHSYSGINIYNAAKIPGYYDGDPTTESYISNDTDTPSITFALRAESVISSFRMYQSNANYRATYKVYVGNDADTLYSEENLIYSWDGGANTGKVQEHYFNAARKKGKFVGIYFEDTTNSESVTSGIRIAEIFVGGTELDTETYNSPRATVEARISADNNLLKGRTPTIKIAYSTANKRYGYAPCNEANLSYLTNGTVINSGHFDIYGSGYDHVLFVYSLGGTASVEGFELFNRSAAQNTTYEVYVADSTDDILNENNLIYSYDGSTDIEEAYRTQYVHFASKKVGSYIAIKLIKTYGANTASNNFRISEIAAYGTVETPNTYELHSTRVANSYADSNLLSGLTAETNSTLSGSADGWNEALTDGDVSSKKDIKGVTVGTTNFTYDIGYTAVFDKFIVGQYGGYSTGIEYYVSHDKDTLYNAENLVATYDINELRSVNESYDASVVFCEDSKPVGRYVGLRVVYSSTSDGYLRLYEISALGEIAPMELTPHNYDGFKTGFEDGDSTAGIGGTAYIAVYESDTNVYSGGVSRLFSAGSAATDWIVEDYLLEAGRTYDISFRYKSEITSALGTVNGNTFGGSNGEWKEYKETITTEKEGNLTINLNTAEANVYIDDISIIPVITVINDGVVGGTGAVETTTNDEGTKLATFTATRDFGYSLLHWTDMAGNVVSTEETYVATNPWPGYTLKPVFVKQQLAFDFEDEDITSSAFGTHITPETDGYSAKFVYSGNKSILHYVSNSATLTLPVDLAADATYTVSFKYLNMNEDITITAAIGLNGTAAETITLDYDDEWQTCSAEVTTSADSDEATITISGDSTNLYIDDICIIPDDDQLTLSVAVGNSENGTGTADYSRIVPEMPVKFTATANEGYVFDKWINAGGETVSRNSTFVMLNITEDLVLTPVFVAVPEATRTYGFETATNGTIEGMAELYTPETPYYDSKYVHWDESSIRMDGCGSSYTYPYTLKAGQDYKIAFWYFLPETTSATITFTLGDTTQAGCTSKGLWYERFCKLTPTEDMQLTIDVQGGVGPVYIDDIIIEPYHTVSVADSINYYVSVSTVEPLHGDTITATVKRAIGEHELFYGWLRDGVVTKADSYDVEFTVTEDLVIDKELIGEPVYVNRYDSNGDGEQNIADLVFAARSSDDYTLGSDIDRSGDIDSTDLNTLRTVLLGYEIESEREAYLNQSKTTVLGSSDDLTTWIYSLDDSNIRIREAVFDSGKGGEPAEIIQLTDVHFNALNEQDYIDNNPTVISSYEKHTAGQNGTHLERAVRCMEYANMYYDQTIITGDNMSFQTWGGIQQIKEALWGADPSAMITLGNHDMMQRMSGLYPETTSLESRYSTLQENWRHDIYYSSRVIKDKVMVVQMDNSLSYYWEGQAEKLAADIEKARENGYIILIFQHVPLMTNNSEYSEVRPMITNDDTIVYDYSVNDGFDGIRTNRDDVTTEVYNLITSNADVIKGLFHGHYHLDLYSEVKATEPDGTETVIPQYGANTTAYNSGVGSALKITVK